MRNLSNLTDHLQLRKCFSNKLASAEVREYSDDSDVDSKIKLDQKKLEKIAKKSMYRKPDMINDHSDSDDARGDGVKSDDIKKAMRQAEISRFRQNLEKKKKENENFERNKLLRKSMSILERRQKPDMNRQIISFELEMQILQVLRLLKGKGRNKEEKEIQTDSFKFLPNNVKIEIDYENLEDKKELYAIRQIVIPPRKKSKDSNADDDAKSKRKRRKKSKRARKQSTNASLKTGITSFKGGNAKSSSNKLASIQDDEEYYAYEEEESESEFEKSEEENIIEDIQIKSTDDKDTKKRKLREAYYRLAKQPSLKRDYDVIDRKPGNEGPSPNNPLIEVMDIDLNLNEKAIPMPERTLFKTVEHTLDDRYMKEKEWLMNSEFTLIKTPLNRFFYDQLLMNYGLKKLAIK